MAECDDYKRHRENMASQGEGFISRAMLDAEKARAMIRYRAMADDYAAEGNTEREDYFRRLADDLEFGWVEAERRWGGKRTRDRTP